MDHVSHCGTFGNAPFLDSDMFAHFLEKKHAGLPAKHPLPPSITPLSGTCAKLPDRGEGINVNLSHDKKLGNLIKQYHDSFTSLTYVA